MTASTVGLILIAIVTVIVMAAWIALVFYADAHPAWRCQTPSRHDMTDQAARMTARLHEESANNARRQTEESPLTRPDMGASAERAAGIASDKARTG